MPVAAQPGIVSSSRECYVTVELSGVYTRGMTVVDADGISSHTPNVTIIDSINFELFQAHLVESVK